MNRCSKAIIYTENLKNNIVEIKKCLSPQTKLCIAVKADSYGHNAILTSKLAEEAGVEFLAVATVDEGIELRNAGIKCNILLLSICIPEEYESLFKYEITPLIFDLENIKNLSDAADKYFNNNTKFKVQLAVDTGMGRIGCYPDEAGEQAQVINNSNHLILSGMCTHFAVSDSLDKENIEFTNKQYEYFEKAIENVKNKGIDPGICSCSNSAAIMNNKNMHINMVRAGIITYGYYPDDITKEYLKSVNKDIELKPVLSLETKVVAIRHFKKGQSISYGRTYVCENDTDIAILPIGYADGLLRRFSPGLCVTINGKNYPVRGRICMDQCMVELGKNHNVKLWDKVLIFGPKESGALNTADDLAKIGNTISYEVLTSISKRIERVIK
ncbi:MAG: alanine racemase [Spirochaetia bacterium]|nr:alanine racemase [Spirochaetia bacterium]